MKVTCKQCGKEFELSNSEIEFYKSKNLELPKRCKECRELNKKNNGNRNSRQEEKKQIEKAEQFVDKITNASYSSNQEPSKRPKKTLYGVVATVIVAIAALIGSYFGLDLGALDTSGNEATNTIQTESVKRNQETIEDEARKQNFSSNNDAEQQKTVEKENKQEAGIHNLTFRNDDLLQSHYQKHGIEMGFSSAREYEVAANKVLDNPDTLHKTEAEDGDDVYYLEESNEFVVVSTDGYLRTYFNPSDGLDYYNRQ